MKSNTNEPLELLANKMLCDMTRLEALFRAMALAAQEHEEKYYVPGAPDLTSLIEIARDRFDSICNQASQLETRLRQIDLSAMYGNAGISEQPQATHSACREEEHCSC